MSEAGAQDNVFARIVRGESPARIVYRDDAVTAFHDAAPAAPVHVLIVPNKPLATLNAAGPEDALLLGNMLLTAQKLAGELGIAESGYRLVMNVNHDGGQQVYYMHLHLMGGRRLGRMA